MGWASVRRGRAEVFVEPPVGRAPGVGLLRAQLPGEVFAQQRMRIERDERAGRVAVHREQLRGFEAAEAVFPIVVGQTDERFGEAGDGFASARPRGSRRWRAGRTGREPQHRHCAPAFVAAVAQEPLLVGVHDPEGVAAVLLGVGFSNFTRSRWRMSPW